MAKHLLILKACLVPGHFRLGPEITMQTPRNVFFGFRSNLQYPALVFKMVVCTAISKILVLVIFGLR